MTKDEIARELRSLADRLDRLRQQLSASVRTELVEIIDNDGVKRAICTGRGGFISFGLNCSEGLVRADLFVRYDGLPRLVFLGEPRALLELSVQTEVREGIPYLSLVHTRGKSDIWLGPNVNSEDIGLFLTRKIYTKCAELAVDTHGNSNLSLHGPRGRKKTAKP